LFLELFDLVAHILPGDYRGYGAESIRTGSDDLGGISMIDAADGNQRNIHLISNLLDQPDARRLSSVRLGCGLEDG
jgi:hypothetical protein